MAILAGMAPKVVYKALPEKAQIELACKTGKQYAVQSAYYLYSLLSDPAIVQQLSRDELKKCVNQSGQIQLSTRVALTLNHLYYVLTSKFDRFGKAFAEMVKCKELTPDRAATIKQSVQQVKQELKEALAAKEQDDFGLALQEKLRQKTSLQEEYLDIFQEKQAIALKRQKLQNERPECPPTNPWDYFLEDVESPKSLGDSVDGFLTRPSKKRKIAQLQYEAIDAKEKVLVMKEAELQKQFEKLKKREQTKPDSEPGWIERTFLVIGGMLQGLIS